MSQSWTARTACIGFALASFLCVPSARSQTSIADSIEQHFESLASTCFGSGAYKKKLFFPNAVQDHSAAKFTNYKRLQRVSFGALSTFIFTGTALEEIVGAPSGRFVTNYLNIPPQNVVASPHFASLTYSFSCTSAFKTALEGGLSLAPLVGDLSPVKVQLAMNAEANNEANTALMVLYGRFQSPFSVMLGDADPAVRAAAYSAVWLYLARNPPTGNQVPAYLDFLEGWLVSGTSGDAAAQTLGVQGSTSVRALALNANWTASAKIAYNQSFRNQNFDIFLVPNPQPVTGRLPFLYHLYALPGKVDIERELSRASVGVSDTLEVIPGQQTTYKAAVKGLHSSLCNSRDWSASSAGGETVTALRMAMDADNQSCVMSLDLNVQADAAAKLATVTFTNNNQLIATQKVQIQKQFWYRAATYPVLRLIDLPRVGIAVDRNYKVTVEAPLAIDAGGANRVTQVEARPAKLSCQAADGRPVPDTASVLHAVVSQAAQSLQTTFVFASKSDVPLGPCTWTGFVDFMFDGNPVRSRQVEAKFTLSEQMVQGAAR